MTEPMEVSEAMRKFQTLAAAAGHAIPGELLLEDPPVERTLRADMVESWLARHWAAQVPVAHGTPQLAEVAEGHSLNVVDELTGWADAPGSSANLILMGPVGTGKSHAALAAAREWLARRYDELRGTSDPVFQVHQVVELLDAMRPGGDDQVGARAARARLLLLDDLGAERATEWAGERLYGLVNRRWLDGLATIVTTNVPAPDLTGALGDRVLSRLAGGATVLRLTGPDRRRA